MLSYQSTGSPKSPKESQRNLTDFRAWLNLMKFNIGLGIISLPEATKHVGWLTSLVGLAVMAFITVWGILFAVESRFKLDGKEQEARDARTARIGDSLESEGDPLVNRQVESWQDLPDSGCGFFDRVVGKVFGRSMQLLFAACVMMGQFTTLVLYLIVIVANLESYFTPETNGADIAVLISVVVLLGVFTLIPTLQEVAILSAVGLLIYVFLFVGLLVELVHKVQSDTLPATVMVKSIDRSAGQWFGVSCFAYSAFPLAMVVYEEMIDPKQFHTVISWVFIACWAVYSAFAMLGYHCYGDDVQPLFYFNFPVGSTFRNGSAGALACILGFSWTVQAMPVFRCAEKIFEGSGLGAILGVTGLPVPVLRWSILALALVVAYAVPSVKVIMDTVGATSGVLVGFIFPALTYLALSSRDEWLARCRCCIVIFIGVAGAFASISSERGGMQQKPGEHI